VIGRRAARNARKSLADARHDRCEWAGGMRTIALLFVAASGACGAGGANDSFGGTTLSDAGASSSGCLSSSECPTGWTCSDFGSCQPPSSTTDGGVAPPPETEFNLGAPISSQRFVYVAMTAQNELARIDGRTLAVIATPVGHAPKVVASIPGSDGAVVLDSLNGTATVVRPGTAGQPDSKKVLGTLQNLNRVDIDPTGRYAVAWFDLQQSTIAGVGSFQDVTVIALAPSAEHAVDLTVGFRPRNVQFDKAGNRAFVVTQDGVSVIDLGVATAGAPTIVPPIAVADPSIAPDDLEVDIVATGEYAVVRQAGASTLRFVDMHTGAAQTIALASPATDIDLAPDGARVYAVERAAKKLAIVNVPGGIAATIDLADATIGSLDVSRDGTRALLYTNATLDERLTMVSLDQPGFPHVTWPLKKSVRAVGIAPDGKSAIVIHAKAPGDPTMAGTVDEYIDESYGYSLVDLATGFAKLQLTPVDPGSFAYAPDGSKAYIALDGGDAVTATRALQIVTVATGVVKTVPLGSPPSGVGILPGTSQAFIAQRHPLGRISFVELVTDGMRTVTGFDLNSHVVN